MALLGKAAMILSFDIVSEARCEHDDWHSHEHLPERLAIPGFLRGSRWRAAPAALPGQLPYFVMYEVADLDVLDSPAYLERLNNPSSWTSKMMTHYRQMNRGLCRLTASFGHGLGHAALLLRLCPAEGREGALRDWLVGEYLPRLPDQSGLASAHLFESGLEARLTTEQRIRGKDAAVDWVVLVTGFDAGRVGALVADVLSANNLGERGVVNVDAGLYQIGHSLTDREAALPDFSR
ncbi:hypothetical protein [Propionivibrio limicola]|uniref:hypothetical protein n=1 Tax=Propionivibrio limicola TaxID=167645 RepID=UPI0012910822|nr:hypothetical protein [Propionivibrio limicola]